MALLKGTMRALGLLLCLAAASAAAAAAPPATARAETRQQQAPAPAASAAADADAPAPAPKDRLKPTSSGYLTASKANGAELFYVFFEAEEPEGDLETTPIILWLQVCRDLRRSGARDRDLIWRRRMGREAESDARGAAGAGAAGGWQSAGGRRVAAGAAGTPGRARRRGCPAPGGLRRLESGALALSRASPGRGLPLQLRSATKATAPNTNPLCIAPQSQPPNRAAPAAAPCSVCSTSTAPVSAGDKIR